MVPVHVQGSENGSIVPVSKETPSVATLVQKQKEGEMCKLSCVPETPLSTSQPMNVNNFLSSSLVLLPNASVPAVQTTAAQTILIQSLHPPLVSQNVRYGLDSVVSLNASKQSGTAISTVTVSSTVTPSATVINSSPGTNSGSHVSSFTMSNNVHPAFTLLARPQNSPVMVANSAVQNKMLVVGQTLQSSTPRPPSISMPTQSTTSGSLPRFTVLPSASVPMKILVGQSTLASQSSKASAPGISHNVHGGSQINIIHTMKLTRTSRSCMINNIMKQHPVIVPKVSGSEVILAQEVLTPVTQPNGNVTFTKKLIPYNSKDKESYTVSEVSTGPLENGIVKKFVVRPVSESRSSEVSTGPSENGAVNKFLLCPASESRSSEVSTGPSENGAVKKFVVHPASESTSSPNSSTTVTTSKAVNRAVTAVRSYPANTKKNNTSRVLPTKPWDMGLRPATDGEPSFHKNPRSQTCASELPVAEEEPDVIEVPIIQEDPVYISDDDENKETSAVSTLRPRIAAGISVTEPDPVPISEDDYGKPALTISSCPVVNSTAPPKIRIISGGSATKKRKISDVEITADELKKKVTKKVKKDGSEKNHRKKKKKKKSKTEEKKKRKKQVKIAEISGKVPASVQANNPSLKSSLPPSSFSSTEECPSELPVAEEEPDVIEVPIIQEDPVCISDDDENQETLAVSTLPPRIAAGVSVTEPDPVPISEDDYGKPALTISSCPPVVNSTAPPKIRTIFGFSATKKRKISNVEITADELKTKVTKKVKKDGSEMNLHKKKKKKSKTEEKKKEKKPLKIAKIPCEVPASIQTNNPSLKSSLPPSSFSSSEAQPFCNEFETVDFRNERVSSSTQPTSPRRDEHLGNLGQGSFLWHHPCTDLHTPNGSEMNQHKKKKKKKKSKTEEKKKGKKPLKIAKIPCEVPASIQTYNPSLKSSLPPSSFSSSEAQPFCNEFETVDFRNEHVSSSTQPTSPRRDEHLGNLGQGSFLWHHPCTDLHTPNESRTVFENEELKSEVILPDFQQAQTSAPDPLVENEEDITGNKYLPGSDTGKIDIRESCLPGINGDGDHLGTNSRCEAIPSSSFKANESSSSCNPRDEFSSSSKVGETCFASTTGQCTVVDVPSGTVPPKQVAGALQTSMPLKSKLVGDHDGQPSKVRKGSHGFVSAAQHGREKGNVKKASAVVAVKPNVLRDCIVRKAIHDSYLGGAYPTIDSIYNACRDSGLDCAKFSMQSHLNSIGYKWVEINSKRLLVEDHKFIAERMKYLKKLQKYQGRNIVHIFISEYVMKNKNGWHVSPNDAKGPCLDATRVVVHAVHNKELLEGGLKVLKLGLFRLKHSEIISWLKCNVMPNIPEGSVIILGQHPMFDRNEESEDRPDIHCPKEEIVSWLTSHKVTSVKPGLPKALLLSKVDKVVLPKTCVFDKMIRQNGCVPIHLPKHHMDLNPVEFLWRDILDKLYKTPEIQNLNDFEDFVTKEFARSHEAMAVACNLVRNFECSYRKFDRDFDELLEKFTSTPAACSLTDIPAITVPRRSDAAPVANPFTNDASASRVAPTTNVPPRSDATPVADRVTKDASVSHVPPATNVPPKIDAAPVARSRSKMASVSRIAPATSVVPVNDAPPVPAADVVQKNIPGDSDRAICPVCLCMRKLSGYRCSNCQVFWQKLKNTYKSAPYTDVKLPFCDRVNHIKSKRGPCPGCRRYRYELVLYHQLITLKKAPRYVIPIPPVTELGKKHWSNVTSKRLKKLALRDEEH